MQISIFLLGTLIWIRGIIENIRWILRKGKPSRPSNLKSSVVNCFVRIVGACVFIVAFYFCDLKYLWFIVGVILSFAFFVGLPAAFALHLNKATKWFDEPSQTMRNINVTRCILGVFANTIFLFLWFYSWKHLLI